MQQINLTIYEPQVNFLKNYQVYGFQNQSSMIRAALNRLQEELELQNLRESADLYAEIYDDDAELQELTEIAISGWPE